MPSAQTLINQALRMNGALALGETPDSEESAMGLFLLNSMLESWSTERRTVWRLNQIQHSWPGGAVSRTIGTGGNINVPRPIKLDPNSGFVRDSGNNDYSIEIIDKAKYNSIVIKTLTSTIPRYIYHQREHTVLLDTLFIYPVPSTAITVFLEEWKPVLSFAALSTDLEFPMGYALAIVTNLAVMTCSNSGKTPTPWLLKQAQDSKAAIKRLNDVDATLSMPAALVGRSGMSRNIYADGE